MRAWHILALLAAVTAGGCEIPPHQALADPDVSTAYMTLMSDPDSPTAATTTMMIQSGFDPQKINEMLDARVDLRLPTTLALARLQADYCGVSLKTIGADELTAWEKVIAKEPRITAVQPLSPLTLPGSGLTLGVLREAAARQQSSLLLVYVQADSQVENLNHAAGLYWTGVGLFIAPGTEVEHKTVMQAILVDTRGGMVLGSATGDSHRKRTSAAAFTQIQHDKLSKQTPKESLEELHVSCGRMLADVMANARRIQ